MKKAYSLLSIGIGAGLMYFLDPNSGRRRRTVFRDKSLSTAGKVAASFETAAQDLSHRMHGAWVEGLSLFKEVKIPDEKLLARVRTKLGRYTSHPRAIEVSIHNGAVMLRGKILASEAPRLIHAIRSMRGVAGIANELETHPDKEENSDLAGGRQPGGEQFDLFQNSWSPGTRLAVMGLGVCLGMCGARGAGFKGTVLTGLGMFLVAEAVGNQDMAHLLTARANSQPPRGDTDGTRKAPDITVVAEEVVYTHPVQHGRLAPDDTLIPDASDMI